MPGAIVFARFFPGFLPSFPFDRFQSLNDEVLEPNIDAFCDEWWAKPANRSRMNADRKERHRKEAIRLKKLQKRVREWNRGILPSTIKTVEQAKALKKMQNPPLPEPIIPTGKPTFLEIAAMEGWWNRPPFELDWANCVSPRYAVAVAEAQETGKAVAATLQLRVGELARATGQTSWSPGDDLFQWLAPRFSVMGQKTLSIAELALAKDQVQRLGRPAVGAKFSREEAFIRFFWPHLRTVLSHFSAVPPKGEPSDGWITVTEAAALTGLGKGVISRLCTEKKIKSNGMSGNQRRVDAADIGRFVLARESSDKTGGATR